MGVVVIGQGAWGTRIADALAEVKTWRHGEPGFDASAADTIYVAVPSPYLRETLGKFTVDSTTPVISCAKGLDDSGLLPSEVIREVWGSKTITHLGGPCLVSELDVCPVNGGRELEVASILKNVYAIGFNYLREREGINSACMALTHYLDELPEVRAGWADLFATCMAKTSRNAQAGRLLAKRRAPELKAQSIEGIHTAAVIEYHDLYRDLWNLRNLTELIVRRVT